MSYTPTNWVSGDIITSAKLNKLENGVAAAGGLVVNITADETDPDTMVMDVTAGDLYAALEAGQCVSCKFVSDSGNQLGTIAACTYNETDGYGFDAGTLGTFVAQTANDYPTVAQL